ncbi:DNA repair protein RadA [candidate division WWE3 bacterium CG10_big_fil_rev_8_21_14_0_10_32_10]|uniref:DNA repair protein RadA n=1 Tax=candidate division WWE3 bacterium CG10_big_fil_rev_8_21_14_0_10_32_10 TaxID=1975090 RepID=A0A2H0RA91_UNCKA|nr:MAG: DNA repair protein RadA [candidate division WWE3 bacterium CG10_big_fil_rev_8_21_14_0_10_32_10]
MGNLKTKTYYECQNCGAQYSKWQGQCPDCGKWNTIEEIEFIGNNSAAINNTADIQGVKPIKISEIDYKEHDRTTTGISEFDRVLGGGFVKGQAVLLAGEPGIGKSTLLLQVASSCKNNVYYFCGEESPYQVKQRYNRLKLTKTNITLLENGFVETIEPSISKQNDVLLIVDSVNSLISSKYKSSAGSISQIKETSQILVRLAKKLGIPLILVGQINKEGEIAGPKTLEHLVDSVLILEGDDNHTFRVLRSLKNRFGSVSEVGLFTMEERGMVQVTNPSEFLLTGKVENASGSAVSLINEGTRCYAIEVQALVNKTVYGYPKRTSNGFSLNRLNLLAAVLTKRTSVNLQDYDIYLNIASGLKVSEPAIDLAVCMAIASAYKNKPLPKNSAYFGEIGLNGELRPVKLEKMRKQEAKNMNIKPLFSPDNYKSLNDVLSGSLK